MRRPLFWTGHSIVVSLAMLVTTWSFLSLDSAKTTNVVTTMSIMSGYSTGV